MFKNRFLNTASFLMSPNTDGTPSAAEIAQKERDAIEVDVGKRTDAEGNDVEGSEEKNDEDEDGEDENENEEDDENNEEKELKEETAEEKATRITKEKEERKEARVQKRIDTVTAKANKLEEENAALKKQLEANPDKKLTIEEVERLADEKAAVKLRDAQTEEIKRNFEKDSNAILNAGKKADPKFNTKVNAMASEIGLIPSRMIGILSDLENSNGGAVLAYLTDNIDEAEEIYAMSDVRMGQRLAKISDKIEAAKKPVKQRSNAPNPIKPVNEGNRPPVAALTGTEDMETFVRIRNKQAEEYRKSKNGF